MFYFLIFHTSISANKELDKKLLTTFLYGCILYIILHAILNSSDRPFIQMIKQYFWFILGLDVVCMMYIYKTIYEKQQEAGQGSQSLLGKLTEFLENLVDTSVYKEQIEIQPSTPNNNNNNPVPMTTTPNGGIQSVAQSPYQAPSQAPYQAPSQAPYQPSQPSILKPSTQNPGRKSVEFDETQYEVREYEPTQPSRQNATEPELPPDNDTLLSMITNPSPNTMQRTANPAQPANQLATPIRQIRAQHPSTANQVPVQPPHLAAAPDNNQMGTPLAQIRQQVQQQQQPPNTIPPPISGKLLPAVATKVKSGDGAVRDIKYDPSEFLKDITYDTRLPSEQSVPPPSSPLTKANLGSSGFDGFGSSNMLTNGGIGDDDRYSTVSKVSDLGSMLDFDMKEFENSI